MKTKALVILLSLVMVITIVSYSARANDEVQDFSERKPSMSLGVFSVPFTEGKASAHVQPGDIVAVFSTASNTEQDYTYSIRGDLTDSNSKTGNLQMKSSTPADYQLAVQTRPLESGQYDAGSSSEQNKEKKPDIGNRDTFWTWDLTDLSSLPNIGSVQMVGILMAIGTYCDVFTDEHSRLTVQDAEDIARQFDSIAYPVVTQYFGDPPDVNGNSRVTILLPLAFNGGYDNEPNPQGFSFGAFNDKDQLPPSPENPYSNYRNVLYLNPGAFNTTNPDFQDKWRSILSHEFQHMVNYRYHKNLEAVAIDEGKAMLAEILSGYGLPHGDYLMWANVDQYQKNPACVSLLQTDYSFEDALATYGMGIMWVSYLFDRFGKETFYSIATNPLPGLDGAESVTGLSKENLFAEWVQANIVNGTVNDPLFRYHTINVIGDGDGLYYKALDGFAARPEQEIPTVETQRQVPSYGVEYFRAVAPELVIITGNNIRVFIISQERELPH